jgi:hypothetical protein
MDSSINIEEIVLSMMDEANSGPVNKDTKKSKGWSMSTIVKDITQKYGDEAGQRAKEFIIKDYCKMKEYY